MQWCCVQLLLHPLPYSVICAGEVHVRVICSQGRQPHLAITRLGVVTVVVVLQGVVQFVHMFEGQLDVGQEHVSHEQT